MSGQLLSMVNLTLNLTKYIKGMNPILTFEHKVNEIAPSDPASDGFVHPLMVHVVETCWLEKRKLLEKKPSWQNFFVGIDTLTMR